MTPDLKYLVWMVALVIAQVVVALIGGILQVGLPKMAGNRDDLPEITGWAGRAARAHRNAVENLGLFAILVLTATVTSRSNGTTATGAALFFWSRLAYAVIYVIGVPWLRTIAWAGSITGLGIIFLQLITTS